MKAIYSSPYQDYGSRNKKTQQARIGEERHEAAKEHWVETASRARIFSLLSLWIQDLFQQTEKIQNVLLTYNRGTFLIFCEFTLFTF